METTVTAKLGRVEVRTAQRSDHRWASEFRYIPNGGPPSDWTEAYAPEGFVSVGMALSAGILLGKDAAENRAQTSHAG
ncbi:hypothetical protein GJQ57_19265 [Ralstonia pickettii]|uniref:Uncharacterized protein n=1 Tax=Ralstonia pickettii TaxID=329 RepID=A0A7X2HQH8_RALPI|nr:hypothetical protein [Ralstonia pickettii]MRT00787.1 hypothetical protein [Ralstonia pickettii]NWK43475.1 hypothetical protein [Ralstonia pickettii]